MPMNPKASIIILTYNNLEYTRACLESIYAKTDEPGFELVLVDNASEESTRQFLQDFARDHGNTRLILNATNEGFARGNNIGAVAANGEYLVFLNNDTLVTRGWLAGLIRHIIDPAVGMVGPVTNSSGNESRIEVDYLDVSGMEDFAERYTREHAGQVFEVRMMPFHCVALRRAVFEEVGQLDERFGQGMFEDDDYALRLKEKGYKILCAEDVFIHHWGSASFSRLGFKHYWDLFKENRTKFEEKWDLKWEPHLHRSNLVAQQIRHMFDGNIWMATLVSERDQAVLDLQAQMKERSQQFDSQLTDLWNQVKERDRHLSDLHQYISERNQYIDHILNSTPWKVGQSIWNLRLRLFPPGSLRDRILLLPVRVVRTWKNDGFFAVLKKGVGKLFRSRLIKAITHLVQPLVPKPLKDYHNAFMELYPLNDRSEVVLYADPSAEFTHSPLTGYVPRQPLVGVDGLSHDLYGPHPVSKLKVSLIVTVRNEADHIEGWLASILNQSRRPDEIIITDSGSDDGTKNMIREFAKSSPVETILINAPGANIAKGRNIAIQNASFPIIACTDCHSIPDRNWLQYLVLPFERDEKIELSAGYYQSTEGNWFQRLWAHFLIFDLPVVDPQKFMPSSRSLAMKKIFWARVGGYPEWLTDAGEDTLFDYQAKMQPSRWAFVPAAKVNWQLPENLPKLLKKYYRYSKGEGEVGLLAQNYWRKVKNLVLLTFLSGIVLLVGVIFSIWVKQFFWVGILVIIALVFLIRVRSISIARKLSLVQALVYEFCRGMVNIAQLLGFAKGVANRPMVKKRQIELYVHQLEQILQVHSERKGVIVYPPTHDWGFMFQRPHHIARTFAQKGYLFFFCVYNLKTDAIVGFQEVEPGLYACYVPMQTFHILKKPFVYVSSPWHLKTLLSFDNPQLIYDHYDDIGVWGARQEDHQALLRDARVVLATARRLLEEARVYRPDTIYVPNGVDYQRIKKLYPSPDVEPPDDFKPIADKGKPIIGYSGALAEWFDYELVMQAASARPDLEFVFVGANYDGSLDRSRILESGIKNVHWLGMKPYDELFQYVWRFDVGIIPFKINEITLSTSPIKQFEYMACRLPVVSTALPESKNYPAVFVAETVEQFIELLDKALCAKKNQDYLALVDKIAQENTWDERVDRILGLLEKS